MGSTWFQLGRDSSQRVGCVIDMMQDAEAVCKVQRVVLDGQRFCTSSAALDIRKGRKRSPGDLDGPRVEAEEMVLAADVGTNRVIRQLAPRKNADVRFEHGAQVSILGRVVMAKLLLLFTE
jgi:hypothetical protein